MCNNSKVHQHVYTLMKFNLMVVLSLFVLACAKTPDEEGGSELSKAIHTSSISPNGTINTPSSNIDVVVGNSFTLQGSAVSPRGSTNFTYIWDFGPYTLRKVGSNATVLFDRIGTVNVRLLVRDNVSRVFDPTPDTVTINVVEESNNSPTNSAPTGVISSPSSDRTISIGGSVFFGATGSDPDGNALSYLWDFGNSGIPNSTSRVPGSKTFQTPGVYLVSLTAFDSTGVPDPNPPTVTITVNGPQNSAPNGFITSPAVTQNINVGDAINFAASYSDPDGDTVRHLWSFGAGSGISDMTKQSPGAVRFNSAGTFVVTYTAIDSLGVRDPSPDQVTVNVSESNTPQGNNPPNGRIDNPAGGSVSVNVGSSMTFSGSAIDPDGDTNLRYIWDFGGYAPNAIGQNKTLTFDKEGSFLVKLKVIDSTNLSDPTPASVSVNVGNTPTNNNGAPNGNILSPVSTQTIFVNDRVDFVASYTDPDGDAVRHRWSFGSGSGIADITAQSPSAVQFKNAGTFNVTYTVTDSLNASDPTPPAVTIVVRQRENTAPNSTILSPLSNQVIQVGESINFAGQSSDADGDPLVHLWVFGAGSGVASSTQKSPGLVTFSKAGTYTVSFTATDSKGLSDPTPAIVTVTVNTVTQSNVPEGVIDTPASAVTLPVGSSLTLRGSASGGLGNGSYTYLWDFGAAMPRRVGQQVTVNLDSIGLINVKLTVRDSTGVADPTPAETTITVADDANNAPDSFISLPSSNMTIGEGDSLVFTGLGIDLDGDTQLSYLWDFNGGAANSTLQNPGSVTFLTSGVYQVSLTAIDSRGFADPTPAVVQVTVRITNTVPVNNAPITSILSPAGDMTISEGEFVFFRGTATDVEGNTPLRYLWNFDGAMPNSSAQNPGNMFFQTPGIYRVTLTATDSFGATDATPEFRIITVTSRNSTNTVFTPESTILAPQQGNIEIEVGDSVTFSGTGNDPDGDTPLSYYWNFDGAAPNSLMASPGSVQFDNAGIYNVSFRVTDASGLKDPTPAVVQVVVTNPSFLNEPPNGFILSPFTNVTINAGDSVSFSGLGFDPDGDAINYNWDFNGAASNVSIKDPGNVVFNTAGIYNVRLITTDDNGLQDPTPPARTITVRSTTSNVFPPDAIITTPSSTLVISSGDSVDFSGTGTDPDGDYPLAYHWNFDGARANSTLQNPGLVAFNTSGTYRVRLNVIDQEGLSDPTPAERVIIVLGGNSPTSNTPPVGIIDSPATDLVIFVGDSVNFSASATDAENNNPIRYRWNFNGLIPSSTSQVPGTVTFTSVGTYRVEMTATDSLGLSDATPAERIITVIGITSANQSPNSTIDQPASNMTINVGDSVYFAGSGVDPDNNMPMTYYWDFAGATANRLGATLGDITFNKVGSYPVSLKVIDSLGAIDSTPAMVTINVINNAPSGNNPPNGTIVSPLSNVFTVNRGDTFTFRGAATDADGDTQMSYLWSFDGYRPRAVGESVTVNFDKTGQFTVTMSVKDSTNLSDPSPATVLVTVQ